MSDRWAVATGDWSDTATWNGGTLPTSGDDVYADGYTVTIDQTITVTSINTSQRSGGTAGGGFVLQDGNTINANINAGTTTCLVISDVNGTFTINGNITGGSASYAYGVDKPAIGGTLNINGNISGGIGGVSYGVYNDYGTLNINGNIQGGYGGSARGLGVINDVVVYITGNVTGGVGGYTYGIDSANTTGTITIIGNVTGGSANSFAHGISSSSTLYITGNVTGGAGRDDGLAITGDTYITGNVYGCTGGSYGYGISYSGKSLTINGDVYGGTGDRYNTGISLGTAVSLTVNGDVYGGSNSRGSCPGIQINSSAATVINGSCIGSGRDYSVYINISTPNVSIKRLKPLTRIPLYSPTLHVEIEEIDFSDTGYAPFLGYVKFKNLTTDKCLGYVDGTSVQTLVDSATVGDYPVSGDVRSGTVYNFNAATGLLAVPNANQVSAGVAVDNTVGTAVLTTGAIAELIQSNITSNSTATVERSPVDQNPITFGWPALGASISGEVSINNGALTPVSGNISFVRTESTGKHFYALSYHASDRPSTEGIARYVLTDGSNNNSFNLRVEGFVDTSALALENSVQSVASGVIYNSGLLENIPNNTEFQARTIPSADYFDPSTDVVANVTLVDTTTDVTNIDLSNVATSGQIENLNNISTSEVLNQVNTGLASYDAPTRAELTSDKNEIIASGQANWTTADVSDLATQSTLDFVSASVQDVPTLTEFEARTLPSGEYHSEFSSVTVSSVTQSAVQDIWSTYSLPESYATSGVEGTPAQILYFIQQTFSEFGVSGVTISVKKLDGTSTAAEFLLDNDKVPTSRTRVL